MSLDWPNFELPNNERKPKLLIQIKENYKKDIIEAFNNTIKWLKLLQQELDDKTVTWNVLPDWKTVTKLEDWTIVIWNNPNESTFSGLLVSSLSNRFIHHKEFINLAIRPDIKLSSEAYREIFEKLEWALVSIDFNFQKTIVHSFREYQNIEKNIDFWDPNSKNLDVIQFREIVKALNAKYFIWKTSIFSPALYD